MVFSYHPPTGKIPILFQDSQTLVIDKPAGLLSVPGRAETHKDCLINRLESDYPNARIVHRLDMDTSGVIIVALNPQAQKNLSKQFEKRLIKKTYIADVWNVPEHEYGQIDLPLRCDWPNRPLQMVDHELGKQALTHWRVLKHNDQTARLELTPKTGRSHQLRVHCQSMGHAILGDRFYAPPEALDGFNRLHLHAHKIIFSHPVTDEKIEIMSKVPF